MKVLICYWGRKGGGAEYTYELTKEFVKQYNNKIFTSFSKNSEIFIKSNNLTKQSCHISTFDNRYDFLFKSLLLPLKLYKILNFIRKNQIDVVYTTMGHIWTPFLALMLKIAKVKHVFTVHDATVHPGDKTTPIWLDKIVYNNAFKLVFLSKYVSKQFEKNHTLELNKVILSKHGILRFNSKNIISKDFDNINNFRLVFFGRILKYKGLKHLLRVQQKLEEKYDDIFLEIYGSGDISEYIEDINKIKNIKLVNKWISDDEIYEIFKEPCINIVPYIEASQSGVIPVALSCAIPSIATNIGGLPEQVENDVNGLLINSNGLEEDLFNKIEYLYNNKKICNNFSKNCIDYVATRLNWKNIITELFINIRKS